MGPPGAPGRVEREVVGTALVAAGTGNMGTTCEASLASLLSKSDETIQLLDRLISMADSRVREMKNARLQDHQYYTTLANGKVS